ncbi:30S ribosomal protein S13 [Candidatus Woesearchaeota archaeon]|nr:30S ribosomal protein S13 [Candidatus Woesearchaeota archaeon]
MTEEKEFRHIVRIANTDIDGKKGIAVGMRKIKGIGFQFANMVCSLAKVSKRKRIGDISDGEIQRIEAVIKDPAKHGAPSWMMNRRRDYESNEDKHLILADLKFTQDNDIKMMRKIKAYKGVRHSLGLTVRGQRTKGHFRKNIGKVLGVKKKKGKAGRV